MYEWLTAMVKKSETSVFTFAIIWVIGGILLIALIYDSFGIVPYLILFILGILVISSFFDVCSDIYLQRKDPEKWAYASLQSEWKFIENPLSTRPFDIRLVSLLVLTIVMVLALVLALVPYFGTALWIICDEDISKFSENISNFTSVILVLIFMAQTWIFYHQYHHMKQPFFKAPLFWTLFKPKDDTDCGILLKNGGNVPIFNISYHISEVLVKGRWGYKKAKSEEISKDFLPRLDGGSEKELFEKPTEEFKKMRLAVYLSAKTLDGHSTRLFFYKAPGAMDFRLAGSIHA